MKEQSPTQPKRKRGRPRRTAEVAIEQPTTCGREDDELLLEQKIRQFFKDSREIELSYLKIRGF
ncbi:MAG TPA: hypothetical protein VJ302_21065 [Blastocatellia bacterium]|nr:hypothetical protein [Blastocatellia bacterium]